jgi:glyceraldehyde 3-phosphate dehydrogenase
MTVRIGLMGFGRIGRDLFRILYNSDDIRVAAISDIADPSALEYLLRFDTILGRFPEEVAIREGNLYVVGRQIPLLSIREPGDVPWGAFGVDYVIEATARNLSRDEIMGHLDKGARRVILCAPPKDPPDITVVMGVNDGLLRPEHKIVSNGSSTAHCAAPILRILHDAFGVQRAFLTTVHAYTNQQRLADVAVEDLRRGRAAAENIIPQETNADEVVMGLLPELAGRVTGQAMNVPVHNGNVVDLVCWHEKPVSVEAIRQVVRTAASTARWRRIVHYEVDPIVSSDIIRSPYSSTFDSLATMVLGGRVSKTLAWYDLSWGYVHRVVDLIRRFMEMDGRTSKGVER